MVSDELGMQLHDRDTLGKPLTAQEQTQLAAWYAAEAAMFAATQAPLPNLAALETQVDRMISELAVSAQRLQQITVENKSLAKKYLEKQVKQALQALSDQEDNSSEEES